MQLEAVCQQNRIGFRFWNPRLSLECMHQLCGAGQGGWLLWVMASLTVLNILAHEVTVWMRGYGWMSVLCKVCSTANVTFGKRSHIWDIMGFGGR